MVTASPLSWVLNLDNVGVGQEKESGRAPTPGREDEGG